ncbi:hypothetical protein LshimejAT787_0902030 [Lyophyllum shimeji]|uniref:Uncharacterized protein n=1 Tax=Lyophyllum shimeji TaxID=47721 RepID=A0A9P3UPT3_LYOSH|nr:hypothetical protein LshimejAT787_0902030 [Lyophyllum shimeji]
MLHIYGEKECRFGLTLMDFVGGRRKYEADEHNRKFRSSDSSGASSLNDQDIQLILRFDIGPGDRRNRCMQPRLPALAPDSNYPLFSIRTNPNQTCAVLNENPAHAHDIRGC